MTPEDPLVSAARKIFDKVETLSVDDRKELADQVRYVELVNKLVDVLADLVCEKILLRRAEQEKLAMATLRAMRKKKQQSIDVDELRNTATGLLGLVEAGLLVGVSRRTVLNWIHQGKLKPVTKAGTKYFVDADDVRDVFRNEELKRRLSRI
jgi:excisionase family DNA binding protein